MRKPRLHTRSWWRFTTLRVERFKEVLRQRGDILDKDFIEQVQKRRSSAASTTWKLTAIQLPIFTFLVLSLIPIQASVTIFGVSPGGSKNLREVLVVASALLGVGSACLGHYRDLLGEIVSGYVERRSKGNSDVADYLGIGLGTTYWLFPNRNYGNVRLGSGFLAFMGLIGVIAAVIMLTVLAGAGYIHFLVLRDIYTDPSFSRAASLCVIAFVIACDTFSILVGFLSAGMFPLQDFTNMHAVAKLNDRDPKQGAKIYEALVRHRRPWLLRHLVRVKMPKKLPRV